MNINKVVVSILTCCVMLLTASCQKQLSEKEYINIISKSTQANDYSTALINIKNALQKYPHNEDVRLQAGRFYYKIGYFVQAQRFLKPALAAKPLNDDDIDKYFESLIQQDDLKQLTIDLTKIEFSDNAKSYKARLKLRQGHWKEAKALLAEVKQTSLISYQLALYELKFEFKELAKESKNDDIQSLAHNRKGALGYLQNLSENFVHEPRFKLIQAKLLADTSKHQHALDIFVAQHQQRPELPNINVFIIHTSLQIDNFELAEKHIALARNAGDKRPIIDQFEAIIAYQNNDFEKSQLLALKALQDGLPSKANRIVAGVSAFKNGRYQIAYSTLSPISELLAPKDPVLRILTLLELRESKLSNALHHFEKMSVDDISDIKIASYLINNVDSNSDPVIMETLQNQLKEKINSSIIEKKATQLYKQIAISFPNENKRTYFRVYRLIEKLLDPNTKTDALNEAETWIKSTPQSDIAKTVFALSVWANNQDDKANLVFDKLLTTNNQNLIALSFKLQLAVANKNWSKAATIAKTMLTLDKNQLSTFIVMLEANKQLPIKEQVQNTDFIEGLMGSSENNSLQYVYIEYLRSNNRWTDLETYLTSKTSQTEWSYFHWYVYADIPTQKKDWVQTDQRLTDALKIYDTNLELKLLQIENLIRLNQIEKAKIKLALVDAKGTLRPLFYELSGNIAVIDKDYDSAKTFYLQSFEQAPNPTLLFKLFKLATLTQKFDEALDATTHYLSSQPNNLPLRVDAFNWYAPTHAKQALAFVDSPIMKELIENNWQLSNNIAWYYHKIGNQTKAKYFIELAIKSQPKNTDVIHTYQLIHSITKTGNP